MAGRASGHEWGKKMVRKGVRWIGRLIEGPKRRPEEVEWEPIKISFEIDPSAYIPKITTSPRT